MGKYLEGKGLEMNAEKTKIMRFKKRGEEQRTKKILNVKEKK